jgi:hypothetical protein
MRGRLSLSVLLLAMFAHDAAAFSPIRCYHTLLSRGISDSSSSERKMGLRSVIVSASSFDSWLEKNGARSACTLSDQTRKLLAKQDLKSGSEACSIPLKLCITEQSAKEAFGKLADEVDFVDPDAITSLKYAIFNIFFSGR